MSQQQGINLIYVHMIQFLRFQVCRQPKIAGKKFILLKNLVKCKILINCSKLLEIRVTFSFGFRKLASTLDQNAT